MPSEQLRCARCHTGSFSPLTIFAAQGKLKTYLEPIA
jgi:hypothetical protein